MSSNVPNTPATLEERLTALEGEIAASREEMKRHTEAFTESEARIFGLLQPIIDGLKVVDQKIGAHRGAEFLGHLSQIYPKKRTVVFMGRSYFGDNIKYAYLAFLEHARRESVTCHFVTRDDRQYRQLVDAGLPCLPPSFVDYDPKQIEILLEAAVLVLDEQFIPPNWHQWGAYALLRGAKTVQLWHGIPLKKIGLETLSAVKVQDLAAAEIFAACGPFDLFVAPSAAAEPKWKRQYAFHRYGALGYPRDDVFFRDVTKLDALNLDLNAYTLVCQSEQPVILYAPTFRDQGGLSWFSHAHVAELAEHCRQHNYLFFVNLHPGDQGAVDAFRVRYPTIGFVEPQTDIYPILKHVDLLITDYSSLAFDFLLLDRAMIFYRPDHEDYVARSRQMIEGQEDYICGPVALTVGELTRAVDDTLTRNVDAFQAKRAELVSRLFDQRDGLAGRRVADAIIDMVGRA